MKYHALFVIFEKKTSATAISDLSRENPISLKCCPFSGLFRSMYVTGVRLNPAYSGACTNKYFGISFFIEQRIKLIIRVREVILKAQSRLRKHTGWSVLFMFACSSSRRDPGMILRVYNKHFLV